MLESGVDLENEESLRFISLQARDFLSSLLSINPEARPSAEACLAHSWFTME